MEALDTRMLLAVTFKFNIVDPGGTFNSLRTKFQALLDAAGHEWSTHLIGNATLEYDVGFADKAPPSQFNGLSIVDRLAQGGAKSFVFLRNDTISGAKVFQVGTANEIKTGVDPNGIKADAGIAIFAPNVKKWFFDPHLNRRTDPIPLGLTDGYSVLLQEIAHTLGFASTRDPVGNVPTSFGMLTYDQHIQGLGFLNFGLDTFSKQVLGLPDTTPDAAVQVYGIPVPLAAGDPNFLGTGRFVDTGVIDQIGQFVGNFTFTDDLSTDLMGGVIQPGDRKTISRLDLAILKDAETPVSVAVGAPNGLYTVDGTGLSDVIDVNLTNGTLLIRVNNSVTSFDPTVSQNISALVINGLNGNDVITISGQGPAVAINGGAGNDTILGGPKGDSIFGGGGNDLISGRAGGDLIRGGDGKDSLYGNGGADRIFGEAGNDHLDGGEQFDRLFGGGNADTLIGAVGDDFLSGDNGNDILSGAGGTDRMDGGAGADVFYGGAGTGDSVDYSKAATGVTVTIDASPDDGMPGEADNVIDAEVIIGSSFNDVLIGDEGVNFLIGDDGNDTLNGGGGDDTLEGSAGNDVIDGGGGVDSIRGGDGNDTIVGGSSADSIFGEGNDDSLFSNDDGTRDTVDGGDGIDSLTGDTVDILTAIESQNLTGPTLPLP
jgi:Ca2+-binding RTX toxin-like protein